jgi:Xaa-Pro aminopeptidase
MPAGLSRAELGEVLAERGLDAILYVGDSICDSDMYYLSGFFSTGRFALLAADEITLLVSAMERRRASQESRAARVVSTSDYGILEKVKALGSPAQAYLAALLEFLRDNGILRLGVPTWFPAGIYQGLSQQFQVSIVESPASRLRAVKTEEEIGAMVAVQRSGEAAMKVAMAIISRSEPKGEQLYCDGTPLTSERVRCAVEMTLIQEGCEAVETIVAGAPTSANPHAQGSGPLPANAPIVIDIFPRSKSSRYFADMTRTVIKGEAEPEVQDIYEAVLAAQLSGMKAIRAGVAGREVHEEVCRVLEERGYPEREGRGFIHSTGHGVGLDVHERPSLGPGGETLEANNVVTVEPGLYYPELGGVRLEDLVVVTPGGCKNLTGLEKHLLL